MTALFLHVVITSSSWVASSLPAKSSAVPSSVASSLPKVSLTVGGGVSIEIGEEVTVMTKGAGDGISVSMPMRLGKGLGAGVSVTAGLPLGAVGASIIVGALVPLTAVGSQVGFCRRYDERKLDYCGKSNNSASIHVDTNTIALDCFMPSSSTATASKYLD